MTAVVAATPGVVTGGSWRGCCWLGGRGGGWAAGSGDQGFLLWVSSPCFSSWVEAYIHASRLQDALFSVTNRAEELSDRQLVAQPLESRTASEP